MACSVRRLYWLAALVFCTQHLGDGQVSGADESARDYHDRGMRAAETKAFDLAISCFDRAIALKPEVLVLSSAYANRGVMYAEKGNYQKALADLTMACQLTPLDSRRYFNRACVYEHQNENEKAIADLTQALSLTPDYSAARRNRAAVYFRAGKYSQAIEDLSEVLRRNANDTWALQTRGRAYLALSFYPNAIGDFTSVIRLDPDQAAEAYYMRGLALHNQGKYDAAVSDFEQAIRHDPGESLYHGALGFTYLTIKSYGKAVEKFDEVIRLDKDKILAYQHRAEAHRALGAISKAEADDQTVAALKKQIGAKKD
jgi:tetratricopeptide (TPR) repeat protein